jgi:hypothetical protein
MGILDLLITLRQETTIWLYTLPKSAVEPSTLEMHTLLGDAVTIGVVHAPDIIIPKQVKISLVPTRVRPNRKVKFDVLTTLAITHRFQLTSSREFISRHLSVSAVAGATPTFHETSLAVDIVSLEGDACVHRVEITMPASVEAGDYIAILAVTLAGSPLPRFPVRIPILSGGMSPPLQFGNNLVSEGEIKSSTAFFYYRRFYILLRIHIFVCIPPCRELAFPLHK